jgi:hypothetical protein
MQFAAVPTDPRFLQNLLATVMPAKPGFWTLTLQFPLRVATLAPVVSWV